MGPRPCLLKDISFYNRFSSQITASALCGYFRIVCSWIVLFADFISEERQEHYKIFVINKGSVVS